MDLTLKPVTVGQNVIKFDENVKSDKINMPFSEFLKKSVYDVSDSQQYVDKLNDMMIAGKLDNLHDVTVAAEIANINFLTLVTVKNKVMDAYREIMRIQI